MPAVIESQTAGGTTVSKLHDLEAEQRALAASTQSTTQTPPPVKEVATTEVVAKEVEEPYKAPIEGSEDVFDYNKFLEAKGKAPIVEDKPSAVVKAAPAARTFDDIDEDLRPAFKQMSNEAYEKVKPVVLEHKRTKAELATLQTQLAEAKKGALPDNYYEHEMGYVLTPEFSQRSQQAELANSVLSHWREQVTALRNGADEYVPLIEQNGQIVTGAPVKAERDTLAKLEDTRTWAQNQYLAEQAKVNTIVETHRTKNADVKNWVNGFQAKAFPLFESDDKYKALIPDTLKQLPPALQSNQLAPLLARAFITIADMHKILAAQQAKLTTPPATTTKQPSAAAIAGGGGSAVKTEDDTWEQFQRMKKGLM